MSYSTKSNWLTKINEFAYKGQFREASAMIYEGELKGYTLTSAEATTILENTSVDTKIWFVKPLVELGGTFNEDVIGLATRVLKNKDGNPHWWSMPDVIAGFKFVIETTKNK